MNCRLRTMYQTLNTKEWNEFAYFSSNIKHIIPAINLNQIISVFDELKRYVRQQSELDLRYGVDPEICDKNLFKTLSGVSKMFVTFHYGSYRALPLRLLAQGISIAVVLSDDIYQSYQGYYSSILGDSGKEFTFEGSNTAHGKLYLLRAQDPNLFFEIKNMKAMGIHVLVYVDGGVGLQQDYVNLKLFQIDLLNAKLKVRAGFLDIAYLLDLPVHFLLDETQNIDKQLDILQMACYKRQSDISRKEFVQETIEDIYRIFGIQLLKNPYLWEVWFYLHAHSIPISDVSGWAKTDRLFPFFQGENQAMIDLFSYRIHNLKPSQYRDLIKYIL